MCSQWVELFQSSIILAIRCVKTHSIIKLCVCVVLRVEFILKTDHMGILRTQGNLLSLDNGRGSRRGERSSVVGIVSVFFFCYSDKSTPASPFFVPEGWAGINLNQSQDQGRVRRGGGKGVVR